MSKSDPAARPLMRALFHIRIAAVRRDRCGYGIEPVSNVLLRVRSRG
jgi:hypothetical protein